MANFNSQVDLFLTEVSIELLGNKIYDFNGKRQDKLLNLLKALPQNNPSCSSIENNNDFLCSLGFQSDYTKENSSKELLSEQLDFILEDANTSESVNQDIINSLKEYKLDQSRLAADVSELNIEKLVERAKIITKTKNCRLKIVNQKKLNNEKVDAIRQYYACEKNDLLKMSMDTLRLLKYIINDAQNDKKKGKLIGFIYAMKTLKESSSGTNPLRSKPYYRRTRRLSGNATKN